MCFFPVRILLWFVTSRVRALSGLCFDSQPQLKSLVDAGGNSYPIGIWVNDWATGHLTARVAGIVIKEKLGYNVELKGPGPLALDGFFALTGCTSPTDKTDRGCGGDGDRLTDVHINVEVWTSTYQLAWEELKLKYPDKAPSNLGNMGYYGATALYVPSGVQERAYDAEGINLDFYRDYNSSRENPGRHFANPGDVNVSYLLPCNETALMLNEVMSNYLDLTGDLEGVSGTAPDLTGKCYNQYFWLAPGCRTQPSTCLIWFTGGNGWGMFETLLKATVYNMPVATAVASSFANYGLLPNSYDMMLYWWVPDPTFLRLTPMKITFPEHDPDAWAKGDSRTAARDVSIDKHVSQDLESLAPEVVELISRLTMSLDTVNKLMLNQLDTGDSNFDVACRWLKENEHNEKSWSSWLPERGKCFSQFGMYSERTQTFLMKRNDSDSAITCRACPSGFYSSRLEDGQGITFICLPCESGSFQTSGAATLCNPCPAGSYQNETASLSCNRCPVGEYQDVEGGSLCKMCPPGTSTRLLGSVSISDCGCEAGSINIASGAFDCVPCMPGLDCPFSSTLEDLKSGRSSDGPDFVPRIREGYYTTLEEPLEVLHCRPESSCPGGAPGRCNKNLVGTLCAVCLEGQAQTLTSSGCEECGATMFGWLVVIPVVMGVLVIAYYFTNMEVVIQATPFKAGVMASAIAVSAMQALALVGLMSVKWPTTFKKVSSNLQVVLLDLDGMGLSCLSGSDPLARYLMVVFIFPAGLIWLFIFWSFTLLLTKCVNEKSWFRPWKLHFTLNTAGLGMQLGYGTMAAVAMKPLMCYSHPNARQSLITYPSLFCGEREHSFLQVAGISFLTIFVVGFFVICSYAAYNMPRWCAAGQRERVQSFRFFMANFRFDCYWFILLVLLRGFSFALAVVIGTNVPPAQTTLASLILTTYAILQSWMRPWKVPVINATDMLVNAGLLLLVNKAIQIDTDMESQFAETFCVGILLMIAVAIILALILSALALVLQKCGAEWRQFLTLAAVGKEKHICDALKVCADDLIKIEEEDLAKKINLSNSYDVQTLLKFIDLVSELFDNAMVERVKFSRVNPTVMNRRSIASAASDLMVFSLEASSSSTASDADQANRGSIVSHVSESAGAGNELPETNEAQESEVLAEQPEVRSKMITAL